MAGSIKAFNSSNDILTRAEMFHQNNDEFEKKGVPARARRSPKLFDGLR